MVARPTGRGQPPFLAYSLRPGITFTYPGVAVDERARMLMADGKPSANVHRFAALVRHALERRRGSEVAVVQEA